MDPEDQRIIDLIEELLEYTLRLSQVEEDPDIDVELLTGKCRERLSELQKIRPGYLAALEHGASSPDSNANQDERIVELLGKLHLHTRQCLEVLLRCRSRTEAELASLRQTGKAIRAYAGAV